jgi:hypothetical protein
MIVAVAMKTEHIRFSDDLRELAHREAKARGVSFAQFVRSSVMIGATISATRRGVPVHANYERLFEITREIDIED